MDDAISAALADIDAFIIANSKEPVTQANLSAREVALRQQAGAVAQCKFDPNDHDSGEAFAWMWRLQDQTKFTASIKDMLSVPREPLINPCL